MLPADPSSAVLACLVCHRPFMIDTGDRRQWRFMDGDMRLVCPHCGAEMVPELRRVDGTDRWEMAWHAPR